MRAALPTDAEVAAFHRDGYLVVPGLLDAEEMRRVTAWTEDLAAMPEVPGRHMVYHEDSLRAPGQRGATHAPPCASLRTTAWMKRTPERPSVTGG